MKWGKMHISLCFYASIISVEFLTDNKEIFFKLWIFCCQGNKLFFPIQAPGMSMEETLLKIDESIQPLTELTWSPFSKHHNGQRTS